MRWPYSRGPTTSLWPTKYKVMLYSFPIQGKVSLIIPPQFKDKCQESPQPPILLPLKLPGLNGKNCRWPQTFGETSVFYCLTYMGTKSEKSLWCDKPVFVGTLDIDVASTVLRREALVCDSENWKLIDPSTGCRLLHHLDNSSIFPVMGT